MQPRSSPNVSRAFSALVGLTATAILVQAVIAGAFVNQDGRDGWVTVHGVVADATWVLALVTAIVGSRRVRSAHRRIWVGSVVLFVLTLVQTGLGHLITERGIDGLIVVHVPLAVVIFGLAVWLSVTVRAARQSTVAADPYGAGDGTPVSGQTLPVSYRA